MGNSDEKRTTADDAKVQGEGDYEAARRYRKDVKEFVASHDVERAAREAAPHSAAEEEEMRKAEDEGRSHAKPDDEHTSAP